MAPIEIQERATRPAEENLSPANSNALALLASDVERLGSSSFPLISEQARLAQTMMTLRSASLVNATAEPDNPRRHVHAKYQQALKYLQDPILPIRAQGLAATFHTGSRYEISPNDDKMYVPDQLLPQDGRT